jgi:hypothetical protein
MFDVSNQRQATMVGARVKFSVGMPSDLRIFAAGYLAAPDGWTNVEHPYSDLYQRGWPVTEDRDAGLAGFAMSADPVSAAFGKDNATVSKWIDITAIWALASRALIFAGSSQGGAGNINGGAMQIELTYLR